MSTPARPQLPLLPPPLPLSHAAGDRPSPLGGGVEGLDGSDGSCAPPSLLCDWVRAVQRSERLRTKPFRKGAEPPGVMHCEGSLSSTPPKGSTSRLATTPPGRRSLAAGAPEAGAVALDSSFDCPGGAPPPPPPPPPLPRPQPPPLVAVVAPVVAPLVPDDGCGDIGGAAAGTDTGTAATRAEVGAGLGAARSDAVQDSRSEADETADDWGDRGEGAAAATDSVVPRA